MKIITIVRVKRNNTMKYYIFFCTVLTNKNLLIWYNKNINNNNYWKQILGNKKPTLLKTYTNTTFIKQIYWKKNIVTIINYKLIL